MSLPKTFPSIQSLRKIAKQLALTNDIQLSQALDLVANDYGFTHWALMIKYFNSTVTFGTHQPTSYILAF